MEMPRQTIAPANGCASRIHAEVHSRTNSDSNEKKRFNVGKNPSRAEFSFHQWWIVERSLGPEVASAAIADYGNARGVRPEVSTSLPDGKAGLDVGLEERAESLFPRTRDADKTVATQCADSRW